jgi:hypothetical protein
MFSALCVTLQSCFQSAVFGFSIDVYTLSLSHCTCSQTFLSKLQEGLNSVGMTGVSKSATTGDAAGQSSAGEREKTRIGAQPEEARRRLQPKLLSLHLPTPPLTQPPSNSDQRILDPNAYGQYINKALVCDPENSVCTGSPVIFGWKDSIGLSFCNAPLPPPPHLLFFRTYLMYILYPPTRGCGSIPASDVRAEAHSVLIQEHHRRHTTRY